MGRIKFPDLLFIDIHDYVLEYIGLFNPNAYYLNSHDLDFLKRTIKELSPAFSRLGNNNYLFQMVAGYIGDGRLVYDADENHDVRLVLNGALKLGQRIVEALVKQGCYVNNSFPYLFKDYSCNCIVFELRPEYLNYEMESAQ